MDKNKGRPTSLPMKVSVDIVLTQYSVYVWEPIEDFPCDLGVRDNALIPIVLQGARAVSYTHLDVYKRQIQTTERYAHVTPKKLFDEFEQFLSFTEELTLTL